MGNTEILKRGDLQLTSAGKGIRHSEKAHGPNQGVFLHLSNVSVIHQSQQFTFFKYGPFPLSPVLNQNISPGEREKKIFSLQFSYRGPNYSHFTDEEKKDKWARIVAPVIDEGVLPDREGSGPAPVRVVEA